MRHPSVLALLVFIAVGPRPANAMTIVVHAGESIQAAIDRAPAGATIRVEPGTYTEAGATRALTITKTPLRLVGAARPGQPVVLQQTGTQTHGIWVSPADTLDPANDELPPCGVSGQRLRRFDLEGFTVQGFAGFGVYLACVDGFRLERNVSQANLTYAMFPVRSSHGRMTRNRVSGTHDDACLYTGQDERILVDHNQATDCLIGLQIENCQHVRMVHNRSANNTTGMIVDVINARQTTVVSDNLVADNTFEDNNRPNDSTEPDTSQLPPGIALVIEGADRTQVVHNVFTGHSVTAIALIDFCVGNAEACAGPLRIDPHPDDNRVVRNRFSQNAMDVIYIPELGHGNCFAHNQPATLKVTGGPLPTCR
jgi:hypothetical protein